MKSTIVRWSVRVPALFAAASLQAATVGQILVRQQWPWSTDVKVEYTISDVTSPVDVGVRAFSGDVELDRSKLASAISGTRFGITEGGAYSFTIDPVAAFGTNRVAISDFRVQLETSDSATNETEVLYKIFDLADGSCEDVTRADLHNGRMGSYETDFGKFGTGFNTALSDVLIWTDVTNQAKYATTHMVFRRISAKDATFMMGSPSGERNHGTNETQHAVSFSEDYFMAVFPITKAQIEQPTLAISAKRWEYGVYSELNGDTNRMPATCTSMVWLRGTSSSWPADGHNVDADRFLGKLRSLTGGTYLFDIPTEAQWEYAYRAGTTTILYDGIAYPNTDNSYWIGLRAFGWFDGNSMQNGVRGFFQVGLKAPNAFGLYDMVGNIFELCLDRYNGDYVLTESVQVDPVGAETGDGGITRGGCYSYGAPWCRAAHRMTSGVSGGLAGVRLVFPAR